MYVHLVAHTLLGVRPFAEAAVAWDLWTSLRRGAPDAVAACLMPDHLHQLEHTDDPDAARRRLALRLAAFARKLGYTRLWDRLPDAEIVPDLKHLMRVVRYVHLNPCRDHLVGDPLCWPWSTHRAAVGAELEPWITPAQLAARLHRREQGFAEWFHGYVSKDATVHVAGTPLPVGAPPRAVTATPLADIIAAAHAAAPLAHQTVVRRRLAVALAWDQGWRDAKAIARAGNMSARTAYRLATQPSPELVRVGRLYLADDRLRHVPHR